MSYHRAPPPVVRFISEPEDSPFYQNNPPGAYSSLTGAPADIYTSSHNTQLSRNTNQSVVDDYGVLSFNLAQWCAKVKASRSLSEAKIVNIFCRYSVSGAITHRYLICQLRRRGKNDIWLRLDRRGDNSGRGILRFISAGSQCPANDTAVLASNELALTVAWPGELSSAQENSLSFRIAPTLAQLRKLLVILSEELPNYKTWPENCWFFCSIIQEYMSRIAAGYFTSGELPYPGLAPDIRERIYSRLGMHVAGVPLIRSSQKSLRRRQSPSLKASVIDLPVGLHSCLLEPSMSPSSCNWDMRRSSKACLRRDNITGYDERLSSYTRAKIATEPAVGGIRLVCRLLPSAILVVPRDTTRGITCSDILDGIHLAIMNQITRSQFNTSGIAKKISSAYHRNRKLYPSLPVGARWIDYLCEKYMFGGLRYDEEIARRWAKDVNFPTFELIATAAT